MTMLASYPHIKPKPGLVLEAYLSRPDIGSGVRLFVVLRVGRKFIHLYYPPRLFAVQLKHSEWAKLFVAPVDRFDPVMFRWTLSKRAERFDIMGIKYSKRDLGRILDLGLVHGPYLFGKAKVKP